MQLDSVVALLPELHSGNLQFGVDLIDDCARASGALVVHGRDFFLAAGLCVVFEDNDLGVLTAELDD